MNEKTHSHSGIIAAAFIPVLFVIFGTFVHQKNILFFISICSVSIIIILILISIIRSQNPASQVRLSNYKKIYHIADGIVIGVVLALAYKLSYGYDLLSFNPGYITFIVFFIGVTEELIFRGFIQTKMVGINKFGGVLIASAAHTAYKTSLFILPVSLDANGFVFLALSTFAGGVAFGILTEISDNVLPASLGHGAFDIIVYGGLTVLPWWVGTSSFLPF
jgi:membrane protease YdiL (CAAX protease family)